MANIRDFYPESDSMPIWHGFPDICGEHGTIPTALYLYLNLNRRIWELTESGRWNFPDIGKGSPV